jgi:hypothetical protein
MNTRRPIRTRALARAVPRRRVAALAVPFQGRPTVGGRWAARSASRNRTATGRGRDHNHRPLR